MRWVFAAVLVRLRGWRNRIIGLPDWNGLTVPCNGCPDTSPHDAHLAVGALTYLGGRRR